MAMVDWSKAAAGSGASSSGASNSGSSWVCSRQNAIEAQILRFEQARAEGRLGKPSCTIFRVPKHVPDRDKDNIYTPDSISLGLFHTPGQYDAAPTAGENFKVKMVSAFLATVREIRRKDSSTQLVSSSFLQPHVEELETSRRPDGDDPAKPTPRCNAFSNSNSNTMEDRSGSKLVGGGEKVSVQMRTVKSETVGQSDHVWTDLCNEVVGGGGVDLKSIKELYQLFHGDLLAVGESDEQIQCALALGESDEQIKCALAVGESDEQIQCALAMDAVAVATGMGVLYLNRDNELFQFPRFRDYLGCGRDEARPGAVLKFHIDFMKLENQIPLFLLRSVMRILHNERPERGGGWQRSKGDRALSSVCTEFAIYYSKKFLPGYDDVRAGAYIRGLEDRGLFLKCDHLLDCISLVMRLGIEGTNEGQQEQGSGGESPAVKRPSLVARWVGRWRGRWWFNSCGRRATRRNKDASVQNKNFNIPSATRLHDAGIDFRKRPGFHDCDLLPVFDPGWFKATLYIPTLPRLTILTLAAWKNLVAYESRAVQLEKGLESQFFGMIAFMSCLIDTKEDVLLMTRGRSPVLPDRHSTTPEYLAGVFNTILIGYPVPDYARWRDLKRQIMSYHNQNWRRMVLDFIRTNFGKPWLVISVMAAFVLLVLTFLQTIYSMLSYYL